MSAAGFTPIQLYRTTTASAVPSAGNLAAGELAINLTDEALYFKNAAGVVTLLADSSGALGSVTSVNASGGTTGLTFSGGPITSSGTLTLGGTLAVANGGTGVTTSTGTGSVVLSTSPTLVTPALGTPSAVTLTNATGLPLTTGVTGTLPVANGGTGVTTSTGTGSVVLNTSPTLVTPTLGVASATSIATGKGTVGSVAYGFTTNTNTGMWSPSSDAIAFSTAGSERLRIDSSGNVGIGTTSPSARLDVSGSNSRSRLELNTTTATWVTTNPAANAYLGAAYDALSHRFLLSSSEAMRIDASGNVGIGTSSPSARLDVNGTVWARASAAAIGMDVIGRSADNAGQIRFLNNAASTTLGTLASYGNDLALLNNTASFSLLFGTNSTERMRIDSSGNVGIGTSSPTTRLQIGDIGATDATFQGRIKLEDTSGSLQSVGGLEYATSSFGAGYGWKINSIDSSGVHLVFGTRQNSTTWTETMRIDSSGNVGIGTSSPDAGITVIKSATISSQVNVAARIGAGVTSDLLLGSINGNTPFVASQGANPLVLSTNAVERMRIDSSGNVGIGTSSPSQKLQVAASTNQLSLTTGTNELIARASSTEAALYTFQAIPLVFYNNNTERMRIDSSGNVLIGTTTSTGKRLTLAGSADLSMINTANTSGFDIGLLGGSSDATAYVYQRANSAMVFGTNNTERARITSGGVLLVAKTAASISTVGVELGNAGVVSSTLAGSTNATSTLNVYSTGAGAFRFFVDMAGTVNATSTSIAAISDIRLKENVRDLDAGLDTILALQPRRFDWKEGKGKNVKDDMGFIAQEVEGVLPELIGAWKAGEGEPDDLKSVKAGDLIPVLVKAIQELTARVAQLEGN